jgi:hypothetical protein
MKTRLASLTNQPLFLMDSNSPGVSKGLLLEILLLWDTTCHLHLHYFLYLAKHYKQVRYWIIVFCKLTEFPVKSKTMVLTRVTVVTTYCCRKIFVVFYSDFTCFKVQHCCISALLPDFSILKKRPLKYSLNTEFARIYLKPRHQES